MHIILYLGGDQMPQQEQEPLKVLISWEHLASPQKGKTAILFFSNHFLRLLGYLAVGIVLISNNNYVKGGSSQAS